MFLVGCASSWTGKRAPEEDIICERISFILPTYVAFLLNKCYICSSIMDVFPGELWEHRSRKSQQSEGSLQRTWSSGLITFLLHALIFFLLFFSSYGSISVQNWIEMWNSVCYEEAIKLWWCFLDTSIVTTMLPSNCSWLISFHSQLVTNCSWLISFHPQLVSRRALYNGMSYQ